MLRDLETRKISKASLARRLGITYTALYYILKGNRAGNKTMRAMAGYYGVDIRDIVKMNDNQSEAIK